MPFVRHFTEEFSITQQGSGVELLPIIVRSLGNRLFSGYGAADGDDREGRYPR